MKPTLFRLFVIIAMASHARGAVLTIEAATGTVRVSNVTRGGSVVLFSCSRSSRQGRLYSQPAAIFLRDAAGTGVIEYRPAGGIPLRSVFAVIEDDTGLAAFGAHPDFPLVVKHFQES
ncbi:MAG TPA: hypothetical protein VM733_19855, partial [Thermoanaerobaculia bacterium]|nr:hypothetical protein [Thermoanaerobaculia bacterium]